MDISIALCTYNGADYISKQLTSILSQSVPPDEIIIRDDGSTDGTMEILNDFQSRYPSIFDVKQNEEKLGIVKNFENAIRACSGDYIALSDQDDIWRESKLERQIKEHQKTDIALVCHNSTLVTESLDQVGDLWSELSPPYKPGKSTTPTATMLELICRNFVQGSTIMINSKWKDELLPIPETWNHDHYLALQAVLKSGIITLDEELMLYRQHDDQEVGVAEEANILKQFWANVSAEYDTSRLAQWREIRDQVANQEESNMTPTKSTIKPLLDRKVAYEQRRYIARCHTSPLRRLWNIEKNFVSGGYSEFGAGVLSAVNDAVLVSLSPILTNSN